MTNAQINCAITDVVGVDQDYVGSLDAMHEAEKVLTTQQGRDMMMLLTTLTDSFWRATAAQRAEAFLRTLNLWNASPVPGAQETPTLSGDNKNE